ncbi:hypothetical protein LJR027_000911 [Terrabacter sp. LjRoot27]|uniref:hypothetical protein n=1 Tax=Terrabacter sp. LjRoot27 TaxID=3342306 RepID=UPI003ECDE5F8
MMIYVLVAIEREAALEPMVGPFRARVAQAVAGGNLVLLLLWLVPALRTGVVEGASTSWLLVMTWCFGAASVLTGLAALVVLQRRISAAQRDPGDDGRENATTAALRRPLPTVNAEVVACSGGGIRAAAFVLGGMNALQERATADPSKPEPALVAVSGGSYMAAAMALLRGWSGRTRDRHPVVSWTDAYSLRSPELRRLRRHTRDLVEPRSEVVSAVFQWLLGALVNLSVLFGGVTLLGWLLGWVTSRAGTLTYAGSQLTWTVPTPVLICLTVIAAGIVVTTMSVWVAQSRRDAPRDTDKTFGLGTTAERARRVLGTVLLVVVFVFVAVPGAVQGLSNLAANNQPTAAVAKALHTMGFTTDEQCSRAAGESVLTAARAAQSDANLSPGEKRSFEAGACGFVTTVTLSATVQGCISGALPSCPRTDGQWVALGEQTLQSAGEVKRTGVAQWAVLGAVLTTVVGLIRGGMVSPTDGGNRLVARLKRTAFAWIPLLLFSLLVLWILLGTVFADVVDAKALGSGRNLILPLVGLLCAIWVDANVTSLHGYYRRRLANAFAVRRTRRQASGDGAEPLDQTRYYPFSELRADGDARSPQAGPTTIPLSIATTANIRKYDEAPTRRGGIPFVFSPDGVELQLPDGSARRVAMSDYERFAGLGRTTIMSAVAMSGAAVSPMAGRYSKAMSPFRLLLTVLNIRVGVWVPNPLWWQPKAEIRATTIREFLTKWPRTPWLDSRPGIGQVLSEASGRGSLLDRWIYLTDGGHLDNTGLVEAVRSLRGETDPVAHAGPGASRAADPLTESRGVVGGTVIVFDASNDREGTWAAIGDALSVIASDLGIVLTLETHDDSTVATRATMPAPEGAQRRPARWWQQSPPDQPPDFARIYVAPEVRLRVLVVKAVRPTDLSAVELPEAVRSFAMSHSDFPRAATTRQDFGDLEFEAYRQLGWWCARQGLGLLDAAGPPPQPAAGSPEPASPPAPSGQPVPEPQATPAASNAESEPEPAPHHEAEPTPNALTPEESSRSAQTDPYTTESAQPTKTSDSPEGV